ncbi:sugar O-acetyltransferase [Clostridium botulinum]|nr:sugar O-acetyltransferase [Clostridium botulinum]
MGEKEKMIKGELYLTNSKELVGERQHAKEVIFEYNALSPRQVSEKNNLLKQLLGNVGDKLCIESPFRCAYGYNIFLDEDVYINYNCTILDCAKVKIGKNVMIGPSVNIFTACHPIEVELRLKELEYASSVEIGDNVWIGGGVTITPGVKIGNNSVIGAGSVVTKDIPENVVAVGNPCRIIKDINNK